MRRADPITATSQNTSLTKKHDFEKDLEITVLKQGFKSAQERKFYGDKYVCLLGTLGPNNELNHMAQLGSYAKEMYSMYNDFLGSHHE